MHACVSYTYKYRHRTIYIHIFYLYYSYLSLFLDIYREATIHIIIYIGTKAQAMGACVPLIMRFLFWVLAVLGFSWFLLFGVLESGGKKPMMSTVTTTSFHEHMDTDVLGREKMVDMDQIGLYYMSKRRVPNGPDPIHNRRAGKSRQPPGQA